MNRSILKRLQIAHSNGADYKAEIQKFTELPENLLLKDNDEEAKNCDIVRNQKGKERENLSRNSKISNISPGDKVLAQNLVISNKVYPTFDKREYEVLDRKGNESTILNEEKVFKRQVSHLKRISNSLNNSLTPVPADIDAESPPTIQDLNNSVITPNEARFTSTPNKSSVSQHILNNAPSPKVTPLKLTKRKGSWRTDTGWNEAPLDALLSETVGYGGLVEFRVVQCFTDLEVSPMEMGGIVAPYFRQPASSPTKSRESSEEAGSGEVPCQLKVNCLRGDAHEHSDPCLGGANTTLS
ncbi:hypothetical protein TKK_0010157 [Trichogramma kaykai]